MPESLSPIGDGQVTGGIKASSSRGSQPLSDDGPRAEHGLPATPPVEVLDALDRAARVLGELDRRNMTLELLLDEGSGQVRASLSHEGGCGSRELSASDVLNLLEGGLAST